MCVWGGGVGRGVCVCVCVRVWGGVKLGGVIQQSVQVECQSSWFQ